MYPMNLPQHGLLATIGEYVEEYEKTNSDLILKHITMFAIYELNQTGKEFTDDDVANKVNEYMIDNTMNGLVKEGLIDVEFDENGEIIYSLTKDGEKYAKSTLNISDNDTAR